MASGAGNGRVPRNLFNISPARGLFGLALAAFVVAATLALGAGYETRSVWLITRDGMVTQATVMDQNISVVRKSPVSPDPNTPPNITRYTVKLAFQTATGQQVIVNPRVSYDLFQRLIVGQATTLRYAASDPQLVELEPGGVMRSALAAWVPAMVFFVLGLACVWVRRIGMHRGRM